MDAFNASELVARAIQIVLSLVIVLLLARIEHNTRNKQ